MKYPDEHLPDKVDVVVGGQNLVDPVLQHVEHLRGAGQPGGVHVESEGSPKKYKLIM